MDIAKAKANPRGRHAKKRIGRGIGSGHGKTSGRGHKGQKARTSVSVKTLAEGGQRPLFRRLPKRGFNNNRFKTVYQVVNVSDLAIFEAGARVDAEALRKVRLVRGSSNNVKVLGGGEIDRALTVVASGFSKSAAEKIQKAGGAVEVA
jgi:large subunit ribosomal protein L15